jgi:hypothetical protein
MRGSFRPGPGAGSLRGAPGPVHPGTLNPRPSDGNRARLSAAGSRTQNRRSEPQTAGGGGSWSVRRSATDCEPS